MGTKLPRKLEQKMSVVGEQIKLARLRQEFERSSGGRTCHLFSVDCVPNRERCADCGNRNLFASALCSATGR